MQTLITLITLTLGGIKRNAVWETLFIKLTHEFTIAARVFNVTLTRRRFIRIMREGSGGMGCKGCRELWGFIEGMELAERKERTIPPRLIFHGSP